MKKSILLFILLSTLFLHARGLEISEEASVIRQISMCVFDDFLREKKDLPKSFDDIPSLREWVIKETAIASLVNDLAIVPTTPLIHAEQGISNKFTKYKLFAISRGRSFDTVISSEGSDRAIGGRHSILIDEKNSDIFSMWIPENQAQIILKQINDFDPTKQPLAFQGLTQNNTMHSDESIQPKQQSTPQGNSKFKSISGSLRELKLLWILGGCILIIAVVWFVMRIRR